jgi:hypothetical protein
MDRCGSTEPLAPGKLFNSFWGGWVNVSFVSLAQLIIMHYLPRAVNLFLKFFFAWLSLILQLDNL